MNTQSNLSNEQQTALYSYLTVNQLCEKHKAFKIGGVRSQLFNSDKNGLKESGAVVRSGRKILINEPKWFSWLESSQNKAA
jgi:hypothetical protein